MSLFGSNISKHALQFTSVIVGFYANTYVDSYFTELYLKNLLERAKSFTGKQADGFSSPQNQTA